MATQEYTPSTAMADALKEHLGANDVNLTFFGTGVGYHQQFETTPQNAGTAGALNYLGELRAAYPITKSTKFFSPWNSCFHPEEDYVNDANGMHRDHWGVDIYAPYLTFPFEIPIYAIADGKMRLRTNFSKPDGLGNRVRLDFRLKVGGVSHPFSLEYGHLARFALDPRSMGKTRTRSKHPYVIHVKRGDLIGYIGKSGNADTKTECSRKTQPLNINSGHIHLQLRETNGGGQNMIDPFPILGGRLAYHPTRDELPMVGEANERVRITKVSDFESAERRSAMPVSNLAAQALSSHVAGGSPRKDWKRAVHGGEFAALDTDRTSHLKSSVNAMELAIENLNSTSNAASSKVDASVAAVKATFADQEPQNYGDTIADYLERAVLRGARVLQRPAPDEDQSNQPDTSANGTNVLATLMILHEALHALMLGPAWGPLVRGWESLDLVQPSKRGFELACVPAVYGELFATALNQSITGLHQTTLTISSVEKRAFSVTFGCGGLRHAVLPNFNEFGETQSATRTYVKKVLTDGYMPLRDLHRQARLHAWALSEGIWPFVEAFTMSTLTVADKMRNLSRDLKNSEFETIIREVAPPVRDLYKAAETVSNVADTAARPAQPSIEGIRPAAIVAGGDDDGTS